MKKSLVALLLTLGMLLPLQACSFGANDSSSGSGSSIDSILPNADTVTITFRQKGCTDVVKKVKKGETLTDIPFPQTKTGYTVVWDRTDFSNITENIVVEAEETANTYTVTYDAVGGTASVATQDVVYDSEPTLATATREGYDFIGWKYDGKAVLSGAKWTIAQNVTLRANWTEIKQTFTVTFRQQGQADRSFGDIVEDSAFTDIPAPQAKTGYTVQWNATALAKLANVTENIVVEAEETAKTYKVTYDAVGGAASVATQNIEYDSEPTLATATRDGYEFKGWEYNGIQVLSGAKWTIAQDVTLTAVWVKTYTVVLDSNRGKLPGNQTTITVTYGEAYELPTPTKSDHVFCGWKYNGQTIDLEGIWNIQSDGEIKLVAAWYSEWTKPY